MSVWFCIPSARPPEQVEPVLAAWRESGYKIATVRNDGATLTSDVPMQSSSYEGYAKSVNYLAKLILRTDPSCDWIVTGGDDTLPDPNHTAEEIAQQCTEHFMHRSLGGTGWTFGVVQPTGDRFAGGCIDRIAGSPWLGREWCLRANGGRGPFWPEFTHMFSDQHLQEYAQHLGVYWQRPDLIHKHMHFQRRDDSIDAPAVGRPIPPHLVRWNTRSHWDEMKAIYERLRDGGFKECAPL